MTIMASVHFIVFPMMAPGHMIPLVDMARLLASRDGVTVTILSTPVNSGRIRSTVDRAASNLRVHDLRFPCREAGLPDGCENFDMIPSGRPDLAAKFFAAVSMLKPQVEKLLKEIEPPANCIVSDMWLIWTVEVARGLNIPRLFVNTSCNFSYMCGHRIKESKILRNVQSDTERFLVPGMSHKVELSKAEIMECNFDTEAIDDEAERKLIEKLLRSMEESYGVIVNSFEEIESEYAREVRQIYGGRMWSIGASFCSNHISIEEKATRGGDTGTINQACLKWLDMHKSGSVVYASLGSMASVKAKQLVELGLGLEASKKPFIWALGRGEEQNALEEWIAENGYEERVKGRGLLIRGWAPQVLILMHRSIGGFLTHCGWNSTMEGIAAGVPMVTWPIFAEQFLNEKLIVNVLEIGVSLGVKVPIKWAKLNNVELLVKKDEIKEALVKLINEDDDEEGKERRKAREVAELAKIAVQEGGSTYVNLTSLIQHISLFNNTK